MSIVDEHVIAALRENAGGSGNSLVAGGAERLAQMVTDALAVQPARSRDVEAVLSLLDDLWDASVPPARFEDCATRLSSWPELDANSRLLPRVFLDQNVAGKRQMWTATSRFRSGGEGATRRSGARGSWPFESARARHGWPDRSGRSKSHKPTRCSLMPIRTEVEEFVAAGPLPSEDAPVEAIERAQRLLEQIDRPVTHEEAAGLATAFGPDNCFGLAWTLLHLIETAPGAQTATYEHAPTTWWVERLSARVAVARSADDDRDGDASCDTEGPQGPDAGGAA